MLDAEGVHVASPEVAAKLEKKNLSASLISGLEKCPASWFADSFVIRDIIEQPPDNPARRGNLFHKVMEDFFAFPPEERSNEKMRSIVEETLASDDFKDLAEIPEVVQWLRDAVNGYYRMGGKPDKVKVASVKDEKTGVDKIGLEIFVKGRIGESKREILGFVDRLVEHPKRPEAVIIEDWKSGAKPKRWNPKTKSDEGKAEARQQIIYTKLLEAQGVEVAGARLLYPVAQEIVDVNTKDKKFREMVVEDVEAADEKLDLFIERNTFEYNPSFLCAWCPLAQICPQAMIKPYEKMRVAYASQPSPEELLKGFEVQ